MPPELAEFAEFIRSLADTDAIPPDDIIKVGDGFIRDLSPGAQKDQPNPGLVLLANTQTDAGVRTDAQSVSDAEEQPDGPDGILSSDASSSMFAGQQIAQDRNEGSVNAAPPVRQRRSF